MKELKWVIRCGLANKGRFYLLNEKCEIIWQCYVGKNTNPMCFETKDDAMKYMEGIIEKSRYYAKRLASKLLGVEDEEKRDHIIHSILHEIEDYTHTTMSVIVEFTYDMLDNKGNLKSPKCNLDKYGYEVIQYLIKRKDEVI